MLRHAGGDLGGAASAGRDDPVDTFRAGEPLDGELVLDGDDRTPVRVPEAGCRGVPVGDDEGQAPAPCVREDAQLRGARPENEEARHTAILAIGPEVPGYRLRSVKKQDPIKSPCRTGSGTASRRRFLVRTSLSRRSRSSYT